MSWQINCCFFYQRQLSTVHLSSVCQLQMYVLATCEPNAGNQTSGKVKYTLVWNCLVSAQAIFYIRSTVFPLLVFQVKVLWGTAATVYHHTSPDFCVVVCSYHWLESSKPQQREESSYQWRAKPALAQWNTKAHTHKHASTHTIRFAHIAVLVVSCDVSPNHTDLILILSGVVCSSCVWGLLNAHFCVNSH